MRILVDTNVLMSAILKDGKPERIIQFIISRADIEWIVSCDILKEYKDVIGRKKFGLPALIIVSSTNSPGCPPSRA
ncbi:MAG: putative toxin-antitoxin system toxin component, PIN family [Magnetococcales bacterium]|nr:putative toxin-antitoxin system toxin component, PIN family [Magnetococcales bacterium]